MRPHKIDFLYYFTKFNSGIKTEKISNAEIKIKNFPSFFRLRIKEIQFSLMNQSLCPKLRVPKVRFEPTRVSPTAPKAVASSSSATSAKSWLPTCPVVPPEADTSLGTFRHFTNFNLSEKIKKFNQANLSSLGKNF